MAADRADALVALELAQVERAIEHAAGAVGHAEAIESPVNIATGRALLGRALARGGRSVEAVEQLHQAASGYEALGAIRYRDQIEMQLRQLGAAIHRRSRAGRANGTGVDSLSGRVLEVARLIVDRRTNREIANHLFLGLKTVESHVRNIFNKLGVSSRAEVARLVVLLDGPGPGGASAPR